MHKFSSRAAEAGTIILFVLVFVLPLLFFMFSLSLDFSRYYLELEEVQRVMDDAALFAYRSLPDRQKAVSQAKEFLRHHSRQADSIKVFSNADSISLQLESNFSVSFAQWFGIEVQIPIRALSLARGTPYDVLIAVDSGFYLAPQIRADSPWGDSSWRAAQYFSFLNPAFDSHGPLDAGLATQQCFNPVFVSLKTMALLIYEQFKSFEGNSVGVGFYPGLAGLDLAREVIASGQALENGAEARFPVDLKESVDCAAAAEYEQNYLHYRFPQEPSPLAPARRVISGEWTLDPAYQAFVSVSDVVWARPASRTEPGNLLQVLSAIRSNLLPAEIRESRAGLRNSALKSAVIFAGDLPWTSVGRRFPAALAKADLQRELNKISQDVTEYDWDLKIYYVLFGHRGNGGLSREQALGLQKFFEQQQRDGFGIKVIFSDDPTRLVRDLLSAMLLDRQTVVLSK